MKRFTKVTSLLGLTLILGGWANPIKGVKANEETKLDPLAITLVEGDVRVAYNKEFNPSNIVVSGLYDSISYPIVDTSKMGEQVITFVAKKDLQTIKVDKVIKVVDLDAPVLTGPSEISLEWDSKVNIADSYKAKDAIDPNVRIEVRNEPADRKVGGDYPIEVVAIDSEGNEAVKHVNLKIAVNNAPTITGPDTLKLKYLSKDKITDFYKAKDDIDSKATVVALSDIDRSQPNESRVMLESTDSHGNKATKEITVVVESNKAPEIAGPSELNLKFNSKVNLLQYFEGKDYEDGQVKVTVAQNVNRLQSGTQTLKLQAKDRFGASTTRDVQINVQSNNAPVINGASAIRLDFNSQKSLAKYYKAYDEEDGAVPVMVQQDVNRRQPGTQSAVLLAKDRNGASTTRQINVIVSPDKAPVISGPSSLTLKYASTVNILNYYSAKDDLDGSVKISVNGTLNRKQAGTYNLTLVATDSRGQSTSKGISVKVQSAPAEVSTAAGSSSSYAAAAIGRRYVGYRYVFGGSSPYTGFDCSGFTKYVYAQLGVYLPHSAYAQMRMGSYTSNPRPGDLVFYGNGDHVGIYLGGGLQVHALNPRQGVLITGMRMSTGYPSQYRRILR